jgi:hypothetical protein
MGFLPELNIFPINTTPKVLAFILGLRRFPVKRETL